MDSTKSIWADTPQTSSPPVPSIEPPEEFPLEEPPPESPLDEPPPDAPLPTEDCAELEPPPPLQADRQSTVMSTKSQCLLCILSPNNWDSAQMVAHQKDVHNPNTDDLCGPRDCGTVGAKPPARKTPCKQVTDPRCCWAC